MSGTPPRSASSSPRSFSGMDEEELASVAKLLVMLKQLQGSAKTSPALVSMIFRSNSMFFSYLMETLDLCKGLPPEQKQSKTLEEVDRLLKLMSITLSFSNMLLEIDSRGGLVETDNSRKFSKLVKKFFQDFISGYFDKNPDVLVKLMGVLLLQNPVLAFEVANHLLLVFSKTPAVLASPEVGEMYGHLLKNSESKAILNSEDLGPMYYNLTTWVRNWLQLACNYKHALSKMCEDGNLEPELAKKSQDELASVLSDYCPTKAQMLNILFERDFRYRRPRYTANYFAFSSLSPEKQKQSPEGCFFKICFWIYDAICGNKLSDPLAQFGGIEASASECNDLEFQKLLAQATADDLKFCFITTTETFFSDREEIVLSESTAVAFLQVFKEQLTYIIKPTERAGGVLAQALPNGIFHSLASTAQSASASADRDPSTTEAAQHRDTGGAREVPSQKRRCLARPRSA